MWKENDNGLHAFHLAFSGNFHSLLPQKTCIRRRKLDLSRCVVITILCYFNERLTYWICHTKALERQNHKAFALNFLLAVVFLVIILHVRYCPEYGF